MSDSPETLFRTLTTGVYVIGVAHEGRMNAFTAAWVTQVSFDPLLLALSIHPGHASYPLLQGSRVFTVNVLQRGQLEVARHFGCQSGRSADKLAGRRWRSSPLGAPVLLDGAAWLDCRVREQVTAGDHEVIIGQAVGGAVLAMQADPLGYRETGNLDGSAELYPRSFEPSRAIRD